MKKILSILMIAILGCVLFAGCGSSENLSEMEKTRKQVRKLESKVKETYNDAEGMLESDSNESDKYSFNVHINLKRGNKTDKNLSDEYNKICKKIFNNIQADAAGIEKIHKLNFIAIVDDKSIEDSSVTAYKRVEEDGTFHLITLSDAGDFKVKTKAEKEEEKKVEEEKENKAKEEAEKEVKEKAIKEENKATLITTAQEVVKKNLKAPSTAKFPWSFDEYKIKETNSENKDMAIYYVSGYVEAKNSFGAKLRNNFVVKMECAKDFSKYKVLDINITEQ
ncbi:hypothetical protein [Clostridium sp.]|uniref:hypothetical protein n=1 Tax=Clostridium sp. TaxID=1506 RepID=UPI00258016CA|nr:hypothetical protein [Clostridium sp.]MBE6055851.1 hypothetical protein [Clostridium sp.]